MKKLLTLTLLLSLLLCGCAQEEPGETLSQEDLIYGPGVSAPEETVTITIPPTDFIPEDQEAVTMPREDMTTIRVLKRMARLDGNGAEIWFLEYEYDAQGRVLSETGFQNGQGQTHLAEYAYDGDTRIVTRTDSDGTVTQETETLDDHGRVIHHYFSEYSGDPIPATQYAYDEYGNLLSCAQWLDGEDIYVQMFRYTYTPEGRIDTAEEIQYGFFIRRMEYTYDDRGRVAEIRYYDDSGLYQSAVHTWEGCTQTVTFFDSKDALESVRVSTYDTDDTSGNLLYEETRQEGFETIRMEYTYEDLETSEN